MAYPIAVASLGPGARYPSCRLDVGDSLQRQRQAPNNDRPETTSQALVAEPGRHKTSQQGGWVETEYISWSDVEPLARRIFHVWVGEGDLEWARTAWAILGEQGLTYAGFEDGLQEETRIRIRMLALGALYHEFATHAWQEGNVEIASWVEDDVFLADYAWMGSIDPDSFPERSVDKEVDEGPTESELLEEGVWSLVREEYPNVLRALLRGIGDHSELFLLLWLSREAQYAGWRNFPSELRNEVLNEINGEGDKLGAFGWLSEGAPI